MRASNPLGRGKPPSHAGKLKPCFRAHNAASYDSLLTGRQALGLLAPEAGLYPSPLAVYIGMITAFLPFVVMPLFSSVERLDWSLVEAAQDLYVYGLLAGRPMTLLNWAELGRSLGLPTTTLKRYFSLLETLFLVRTLPPWEANLGKRLVKSPKVFPTDSGLALHALGQDGARLEADRTLLGGFLEAFVAVELLKQVGYASMPIRLFHYRSHTGEEVDLLLEGPGGQVVGLEVKARGSVRAEDFRGLKALAEALGPRFHRGVVLYAGRETVPFGRQLHALPLEALWQL